MADVFGGGTRCVSEGLAAFGGSQARGAPPAAGLAWLRGLAGIAAIRRGLGTSKSKLRSGAERRAPCEPSQTASPSDSRIARWI
jgi:hypothetical protein